MGSSLWQAYAKALHYREMEFRSEPHVEAAIESLISINNQLQQPDAAQGVLSYSQQQHQARVRTVTPFAAHTCRPHPAYSQPM